MPWHGRAMGGAIGGKERAMAMRDLLIGCVAGAAVASMVGLDRGVAAGEAESGARGDTCADFGSLGTFQAPSVMESGVIATGSADVYVLNLNGLGIVGGIDTAVDGDETIRFDFNGFLATNVTYDVPSAGNGDGDQSPGEAQLTAFGSGGALLGTVEVSDAGPKNVTQLFGGAPVSAFEVAARDGDSFRVLNVCYDVFVSACAGDLDGDGDTDVFDFGVFAADFMCGTGAQ